MIESDHTFASFEQKSVSTGQKSSQERKGRGVGKEKKVSRLVWNVIPLFTPPPTGGQVKETIGGGAMRDDISD